MCVYYESLCRDRCLQWSWVICLHYTTVAQPPRTIIYSDLPKHTHPETGSMLEAKTLYTRPGLEHIMAFSGLSWCNLTPKQRTPQTKATSFTLAFLFYLHLCQHACKNSCSSQLNSLRFNSCWPLWPAFCSGAAAWPRVSLTESWMLWQSAASTSLISFCKQSSTEILLILRDMFWVRSDMLDLWHKRSHVFTD